MGRQVVIYSDELYHHGVKGQKWGIRRFQNPDGTLTEEGKRHYTRKVDRLTRLGDRADSKREEYESYKTKFNKADSLARSLGPMKYARWYSSASTQSQKQYMEQLGKIATLREGRVRKCMKSLIRDLAESDYTISYDAYLRRYNLDARNRVSN